MVYCCLHFDDPFVFGAYLGKQAEEVATQLKSCRFAVCCRQSSFGHFALSFKCISLINYERIVKYLLIIEAVLLWYLFRSGRRQGILRSMWVALQSELLHQANANNQLVIEHWSCAVLKCVVSKQDMKTHAAVQPHSLHKQRRIVNLV